MPRTDPQAVREELADHFDNVDETTYPDSEANRDITRANALINNRIADSVDDEDLLTEIETLVAAHFASPSFADSVVDGRSVSSAQQGSRQISFANSSSAVGGYTSEFWSTALMLDPTGRLGVRTRGVHTTITPSEDECTD